jgi:hypothetical protein
MGHQAACVVCGDGLVSMVAGGWLIHTLAGSAAGCGEWASGSAAEALAQWFQAQRRVLYPPLCAAILPSG